LDTNVLVAANGDRSQQASEACVRICQAVLVDALFGINVIVLDTDGQRSEILDEYRDNLADTGGGAALGQRFVIWLTDRLGDERYCIIVPTTKEGDSYREFPNDARLKKFDLADHKWVAAALSHRTKHRSVPLIVEALDVADWREVEVPLQDHGINIEFVCDKTERSPSKQLKRPRK
jgi:hypothetical protein